MLGTLIILSSLVKKQAYARGASAYIECTSLAVSLCMRYVWDFSEQHYNYRRVVPVTNKWSSPYTLSAASELYVHKMTACWGYLYAMSSMRVYYSLEWSMRLSIRLILIEGTYYIIWCSSVQLSHI